MSINMSEVFEKAFSKTLKYEGGYVNNPNDRGGETKYGISKRSYPNVDIKNLTVEGAKAIYKSDYFDKLPMHFFTDEKLIMKIFDIAVNCGVTRTITLLQRALKACGFELDDDGAIGAITTAACKMVDNEKLLVALRAEQASFYRVLVAANQNQKEFLKGWLNRAYDKTI